MGDSGEYSGLLMSEALAGRLDELILSGQPIKPIGSHPRVRVLNVASPDVVASTICEGNLASITWTEGKPSEITVQVSAQSCRALLEGFEELVLQVNRDEIEAHTWESLGAFRKKITLSSVSADGALLTVTK